MNEIALRQVDLPSMPIGDVKQYVDIIGDAIANLKSKRSAAGHLDVDKATLDEMDAQIREYSAMKLRAEMELGKKTAEMERLTINQYSLPSASRADGKYEKLQEAGIPVRRASDYERMARNEETVNEYINRSLEEGREPTRRGVLREIAEATKTADASGVSFKSNRQLFAKIRETSAEMASGTFSEYTIESAKAEIRVMEDDFIEKVRRTLSIRRDVIKGSREIKKMFDQFSAEVKKLKEEVK